MTFVSNTFRRLVAIALLIPAVAAGGQSSIEIRDYTGRGFAPDLVHYRVPLGDTSGDKLRLVDKNGKPVPLQVNAEKGVLSFVTSVEPGGEVQFTLRDDGQGQVPKTTVAAQPDANGLVLSSAMLGVRVPKPVNREFKQPVPASSLPAPILAFRGADGKWRGSGRMLSDRKVRRFRVQLVARGPVFAEVHAEYEFAGGGYYRAQVRVVDQVPFAEVSEEFDAGEMSGKDYWELNLTGGWAPDMMEVATTFGNGGVDRGRNMPLAQLGATPTPIEPKWVIMPANAWGPRSQLGLFNDQDKKENLDAYAMAGFVPLHEGRWRRAIGVEIHSADSKDVRLRMPISVRYPSWLTDASSETSPMSINEHDPALPVTCGRRVWALVLAQPGLKLLNNGKPLNAGPFYDVRLLYGKVGLDRCKDFVLDWPDGKVSYPRVFIRPDELAKYRAAVERSPLAGSLRGYYSLSGDAEVARQNVARLKSELRSIAHQMLITPTLGHHHSWTGETSLADNTLAWKEMPAADREELRALLALITYLHVEPDVMAHGTGNHLGNPNMSVARQMEMANFMALVPDHPMFARWRDYMAEFTAYKLAINTAPGGGWFEYGAAYHVHSSQRTARAMMGLVSAGAPNLDLLYGYVTPDWRYYLNLLTPYDSRWFSRVIPGLANSPPGITDAFCEPVGVFAPRDPELASSLQWAWQTYGAPTSGPEGVVTPLMSRPFVEPKEPKLASEIYPGVGVVFRAHQGPDETYMFLRNGYNWSHWYVDDQNHFCLMSKGATLVPHQPFQYYSRDAGRAENESFNMYNTVRFGDPSNQCIMGWPDTNVLQHAFGPKVDYAWSSTGFPSWYIEPGSAPRFGGPRKLAAGTSQQQGEMTWDRQVMFLKGPAPRSPNYFVFRDTTSGKARLASWLNLNLLGRKHHVKQDGAKLSVDTEFPTKLDVLFAQKEPVELAMDEDDMPFFINAPFASWQSAAEGKSISPNWVRADGRAPSATLKPDRELHVLLRIAGRPGQGYSWVVYPRGADEQPPKIEKRDENVLKVETALGVDYVFLAGGHAKHEGHDVVFEGRAGAVRVTKDEVTLVLSAGRGRVGYQGHVLEGVAPMERTITLRDLRQVVEPVKPAEHAIAHEPQLGGHEKVGNGVTKATRGETTEYLIEHGAPVEGIDGEVRIEARKAAILIEGSKIRFVATEPTYARLSVGTVGIRGVGPWDITLTPQGLTGEVDGTTRTLVVTTPAKIVRPMYHMDGVRWYAGFGDDHTRFEGLAEPQFNLALGVTAGKHRVEVTEWAYPAMPPLPALRTLTLR